MTVILENMATGRHGAGAVAESLTYILNHKHEAERANR